MGCPDSYTGDVEILRIASASVSKIVRNQPDKIDMAPFERALQQASGDVIVTSCGFLSYWQAHLAIQTTKPFISSSLIALERLSDLYNPGEILILTFDEHALTSQHLGVFSDYASGIVGLPEQMHLRQVISENRTDLNADLAAQELTHFIATQQQPQHKHLLLECTNLPPYKAQMKHVTGLPITDILTLIEARSPGAITSQFL